MKLFNIYNSSEAKLLLDEKASHKAEKELNQKPDKQAAKNSAEQIAEQAANSRNENTESQQAKTLNETFTVDWQALVTADMIGYADAFAHHFIGRGLDLDDLEQEARLGLCEAARRFDPKAGNSLKTFATYYIKKYVLKAIQQYCDPRMVSLEEICENLRKDESRHEGCGFDETNLENFGSDSNNFDATGSDSNSLDATGSDRNGIDGIGTEGNSLDATEAEIRSARETFIQDQLDEGDPQKERERIVAKLMGILNPEERKILELRFGFKGNELTIPEIAIVLNLKPKRTRDIYNKTIAILEIAAKTEVAI